MPDAAQTAQPADDLWRRSRLAGPPPGPDDNLRLVFGDLHNHSLLSDGRGDPEQAFAQMRAAGLDVAALTDHASIPQDRISSLELAHYPSRAALAAARLAPRSFDVDGWHRTAKLADAHDVPGQFTAMRGFEWTEPWLGHVNVWFSDSYLLVTTPGSLSGLQDWLTEQEPDALFGYNHPGREPGRLDGFALPDAPSLASRMVSLEAFNRSEDFLFAGHTEGRRSPIVDCLDAGWRPGLIGSSDEHGRAYGLTGKGRTGLWVREHSRAGVREALLARRTFATREVGLRVDAALDGVRMGGTVTGTGPLELAVDVAGPKFDGLDVDLQLLTSGTSGRRAVHRAPGTGGEVSVLSSCRARAGDVTRVPVTVPEGTRWLAVRIGDPSRRYGSPAPEGHAVRSWGLAYASPWWFEPER